MLTTQTDLPYVSPLAGIAEGPLGPDAARLADWSGRVVLDVRGRGEAEQLPPLGIGEVVRVEGGLLARLRADHWVYLALSPDQREVPPLAERFGGHVLTDLTHAYGIVRLGGPSAPEVLARLCALDFADRVFPDCHAAQSGLAKVPALIVRLDEDARAYLILVERSVAAYVWTVLAGVLSGIEQLAP